MERLTFEGNFCDIAQCKEIPCPYNGECSQRKVWERLKAYEDTHMMPSDVTSMRMDMAIIAALFNGVDVDRMKELAEADKDGRLVVLPCKVGGKLWVIGRDNVPREMELEPPDIRTVCTDEDNLCMSTCNRRPDGYCAYRLRNDGTSIGKTVFLTREEAEKALEAMKNG